MIWAGGLRWALPPPAYREQNAQNEPNLGVESCETNPISPRRRPSTEETVQNEPKLGWTGVCGKRLSACEAWSETCKTNPISPRRGRPLEEIVQNKAKLGGTRVCGQERSARRAWFGRGVKRAKRTQFGSPGAGAGGQTCKTNPIWKRRFKFEVSSVRPEESGVQASGFTLQTRVCAKRTQFPTEVSSWKC
jgi:hypothetical protein